MHNCIPVTHDIFWIGGNDRRLALFESVYPIPRGVSYNAYLVTGARTVLLDTVDRAVSEVFFENLDHLLADRPLDFVIVNHMEPDHAATLAEVVRLHPEATVVCNAKTRTMIEQFFSTDFAASLHMQLVKEGDTLDTGSHRFTFVMAPMVHWPEVMVTYETTEKVLFSADAFGTFGALDGQIFADRESFDSKYIDDARRYYTNIVGKYGKHVQKLLGKAAGLDIKRLCPLHGQIWDRDIDYILDKYQHWSTYQPEEKGVVIAYASMYGNTESAANLLALMLRERGVRNLSVINLMSTHPSYLVSDAFRYSNIVLAAPTYNNGLQPMMVAAIEDMAGMAVQNRKYSLIANGSWSAASEKCMQELISGMEGMTQVGDSFIIRSSMKADQTADLELLADKIVESMQ